MLPTPVPHSAGRPPPNQPSFGPPMCRVDPPNQPTFWDWLPTVPAASFRCRHSAPRASRRQWLLGLGGAFLRVNELFAISLALNRVHPTTAGLLIDQPPRKGPTHPHKTQIVSRSSRRRRTASESASRDAASWRRSRDQRAPPGRHGRPDQRSDAVWCNKCTNLSCACRCRLGSKT